MNLPPLPDREALHCQPPDHYWYGIVYGFTTLQMQWYGQQCYEQGKADAAKGTHNPSALAIEAKIQLRRICR